MSTKTPAEIMQQPGPKSVTEDGVTVTAHPIKDAIALDEYAKAQEVAEDPFGSIGSQKTCGGRCV